MPRLAPKLPIRPSAHRSPQTTKRCAASAPPTSESEGQPRGDPTLTHPHIHFHSHLASHSHYLNATVNDSFTNPFSSRNAFNES
jgi:hypothetical protein